MIVKLTFVNGDDFVTRTFSNEIDCKHFVDSIINNHGYYSDYGSSTSVIRLVSGIYIS